MPYSLLREFNKMDHFSDRSDDEEGVFSENPQPDYLQEVETKKWVREKLKCHSGGRKELHFSHPKAVRKSLRVSL